MQDCHITGMKSVHIFPYLGLYNEMPDQVAQAIFHFALGLFRRYI
jgi:hypothetical protein